MADESPRAFEAELAVLLRSRAQEITVRPDLEHIERRVATGGRSVGLPSPAPSSGRGRVALVAACVLLTVGVAAGWRAVVKDTAVPIEQIPPLGELAIAGTGEATVVVWLDPSSDHEAAAQTVGEWLSARADVEGYIYLDQATTYVEFAEYYADQPEVIELVDPAMLPPSFRVTTTADANREELATAASVLPRVVAVDIEDGPPTG